MDLGFDLDEKLEKLGKIPKSIRLAMVACLLASVGASYYFMSYEASLSQVKQLRGQAMELQRKLNRVRVVANNLGEFEQEVAALERNLDVALKQLPNKKQFEDLLRDISTAGKKVGIELKSIQRTEEQAHDFYAEVPFKIELEGGYHDVAKFFERVSKLPRIVNVGSLEISSSRNGPRSDALKLRVKGTATTFRFLNKGSDTAETGLLRLYEDRA